MKVCRAIFVLLLTVLMGGCASTQPRTPTLPPSEPLVSRSVGAEEPSPPPREASNVPTSPLSRSAQLSQLPQIIPAEIKAGLLSPSPKKTQEQRPALGGDKIKIEINFDKADLGEVTNQIFGEYLKLNYVMDPTLRGQITLYLSGEFTRQELLSLITKAYNASNIAVVPKKGIYYIQTLQKSTSSGLGVGNEFVLEEDERGIKPAIFMYRLRYLDATQAVNVLRFFLTPGRPMMVDQASNTIIFAEDTENAQTLIDLIEALDINLLEEVGMEVVPVRALSPDEAVKSIETLMGKLDIFKQSAVKGSLAFLPLQQFGGVLILSRDPQMLQTAKEWLTALDVQGQEIGEQVHVYFVQNGLAKDIADILNQVFETKKGKESKRPGQQVVEATQQQPAPGQQPEPQQPPPPQPQVQGGEELASTALTGEVAIIADETNNAIVIKANPFDYEKIQKAIETLDIIPRVVVIEVMLAEISLSGDLEYGIEWFIKGKGMNVAGYDGKYTTGTNALGNTGFDPESTVTKLAQGFSFYWTSIPGDISTLIRFLSSKTAVNVLSTPTLFATDNKEASFTVGGSEPILSQQSTTTSGDNIINNVQYVDTGIILTVTPHINSGGLVRMEVEQTNRDVAGKSTSGINSPSFTERKVKTSLIAKDGQTVVIGGIIQQKQDDGKAGIPVLGSMPVLGPLFSSTSKKTRRTELIIAITPHVVQHGESEATREFLYKLKDLKTRIEAATTDIKPAP